MKRDFFVSMLGGFVGFFLALLMIDFTHSASALSLDRPAVEQLPSVNLNALNTTPISTTFTYQGQLKNSGNPVNGSCSMAFGLYDDPVAGNLIGDPITLPNVSIADGLFTVGLNFGSTAFTGEARWLAISVDCGSGFIPLTPSQALTAAPYALHAADADTAVNATHATSATNASTSITANTATTATHTLDAWSLTGNNGTNSNTNFVGTTNSAALTIRVSNTVAYRIIPVQDPIYGFAPILVGGSGANSVTPDAYGAVIGGGANGLPNVITGTAAYAFIGGGHNNTASGDAATISGGGYNTANGEGVIIGGGQSNFAVGSYTTIGGGDNNSVNGDLSTIGGGLSNIVSGTLSVIGAGYKNIVSNTYDTIAGGYNNIVNGTESNIGGGVINVVASTGIYATIGGGVGNSVSTNSGTISGGSNNTVNGANATVPGGASNLAQGSYSFAAGKQAQALDPGTFVWADSSGTPFTSTANNQFLVRASGGVGIGTNSPAANTLTVGGGGLRVSTSGTTFAEIQAGTASLGTGSGGVTNIYTVTFPTAFSNPPKVIVTTRNDYPTWDVPDTFAVTVRKVFTNTFVVNVFRVDSNAGIGQNLKLDWFAWQ